MESSYIKELMNVKQSLDNDVKNLQRTHRAWITFAAKETLNEAIALDIHEEHRLGEKFEENTLTTAMNIARNSNGAVKVKKSFVPSFKCVELANHVNIWKMDTMSCHPVHSETLDISSEHGVTKQRHAVRWKHGDEKNVESMPFWAAVEYTTSESRGVVQSISNVTISLEMPEDLDKYYVAYEIRFLIDYCTTHNNLPLFFAKSAHLFSQWGERYKILKKFDLEKECQMTEQSSEPFKIKLQDNKKCEIANIVWSIRFVERTLEVKEDILATFSKTGEQLAKECNFPEELLETGKYDAWTPEDYIENIFKMINFETSNVCEENVQPI